MSEALRKIGSMANRVWILVASLYKFAPFISNGFVFLDLIGGDFYKKRGAKGKKIPLLLFVFSFNKHKKVFGSGRLIVRSHKTILISKDETYYLFKDKDVFFRVKEKNEANLPFLLYTNTGSSFIDKRNIMITKTAMGSNYFDDAHRRLNVSLIEKTYFDVSLKKYSGLLAEMIDSSLDIYFCVQHGDFHNFNIFWDNEKYMVIDLDGVDWRPLFYDLFYYAVHVMKEDVNSWIMEEDHIIKGILRERGLQVLPNSLDIYFACFAYETSKNIYQATNKDAISWHMGWTRNFDFGLFPITKRIVENFENRTGLSLNITSSFA